jgi:hypothetical protein
MYLAINENTSASADADVFIVSPKTFHRLFNLRIEFLQGGHVPNR